MWSKEKKQKKRRQMTKEHGYMNIRCGHWGPLALNLRNNPVMFCKPKTANLYYMMHFHQTDKWTGGRTHHLIKMKSHIKKGKRNRKTNNGWAKRRRSRLTDNKGIYPDRERTLRMSG